jgi:hypothetical protein
MYVTVQLQGWAFFPQTTDSIASDVQAQLQADGLTVQAFTIKHPDRWTQITELQFVRFTYMATVQIHAPGDQWDADGITSAVMDAFTSITGNAPSATKTESSVSDPGGHPDVPSSGWQLPTLLLVGAVAVVALVVVVPRVSV